MYPFFDSRQVKNEVLPDNGDANGAYNIARKGIILLDKIQYRQSIVDVLKQDGDNLQWGAENKKRESLSKVSLDGREKIQDIFNKWLQEIKKQEHVSLSDTFWKTETKKDRN